MSEVKYIRIRGARENNLKNLDVDIPRNKLVVFTGLSGSGKSSLAFDTIYTEGQRRYIDSLSAYSRQLIGPMDKADVDSIEGLSPTISVDQKTTENNPRSTVGTLTEIYDYLRLLYARIGKVHCPICGKEIQCQSLDQIVDQVLDLRKGTDLKNKIKFMILAPIVKNKEGSHREIIENIQRSGYVRIRVDGTIYDVFDDIKLEEDAKHSIEIVVDRLILKDDIRSRLTDSVETALKVANGKVIIALLDGEEYLFSQNYSCPDHDIILDKITPQLFSFNNPAGACKKCMGLGKIGNAKGDSKICPSCKGARLNPVSLAVTVGGINIAEFCDLSIAKADKFLLKLLNSNLKDKEKVIAEAIIEEIRKRFIFLTDLGLDYLNLSRLTGTLSGGESQKIKLATQMGSSLSGVIYILDEPSAGLHPKDNYRLLKILKELRDNGNTVIIVEHDKDIINAAEHIIDIGPGAGIEGGELVYSGKISEIKKCSNSITGQYLVNREKINIPAKRRAGNGKFLQINSVTKNNLKNLSTNIPLGKFVCITGVSGSGKSTLAKEIIYKTFKNKLNKIPLESDSIKGIDCIKQVINVDQSPIGKTPRSNPATYMGAFDYIRDLFSKTKAAKLRGYDAARFSFNVAGGRCEACKGDGIKKIEMNFLPDIYIKCSVCNGKRYNRETLEVKYKNKNIYEVLNMTAEESLEFFRNIPNLRNKFQALVDVGLHYLKIGQSAMELSGGEAQRIKLASELAKKKSGDILYILDEPTIGLHMADVHRLLYVLQNLVDAGNTVLVVEHNLDLIKSADYVIDMGPGAGENGGKIIAQGTPEEVANKGKIGESYTGYYLNKVL